MENKLPSKWTYSGLTALGLLCGIVWGVIDIAYLVQMFAAIRSEDPISANSYAKKIKRTTIIGLAVNFALILIYFIIAATER